MLPDREQVAPTSPKLYYITHIDNLTSIFKSRFLFSHARGIESGLSSKNIGMTDIKQRRLSRPVTCHPGTSVGQYVPFYFCPRSVMLYVLYMGDSPDLTYRDGQGPIVHLQFDMHRVIEWAEESDLRWAFSDRNAAAAVASFYNEREHLNLINWTAVASKDFRQPLIKEGKQAEFLVYDSVPWELVDKIGVINMSRKNQVTGLLTDAEPIPAISIERTWYY